MGVGVRVRVPFGHRKLVATVVGWPAEPPDPAVETKAIESVLDGVAEPTPAVLELARFVADYYLCSWGEAIETALPPDPGQRRRRFVHRLPEAEPEELGPRETARAALLAALPRDGGAVPVDALGAAARRAIGDLRRRGWVEVIERFERPIVEDGAAVVVEPEAAPTPTPGQQRVLGEMEPSLKEGGFAPMLLFGATGSGKTEVYFRAADQVLTRGRGVVYLVPEIGLTPLLLSRVSRRFPGQAVVMHSGLSRRERFAAWESLRSGERRFVVGTRSAVFAPLADIGLIVVDEEQDTSYKQSETPRYNARDLALVRGKAEQATVLLGSATPSMESFRHARAGRYRLLRLGGRVQDRPLPDVMLVDMREEYRRHGVIQPVSETLLALLRDTVARGEQALVLRNRRGWSVALFCPRCGERVSCANCSVSLTWHRSARRLRCHYCAFEVSYPDRCPRCHGDELKLTGEGTEQIESLIRRAVPEARVARMDRDTLRGKAAHEELLRQVERGAIDVLVGTQMIAKGHDFPMVTLVGVLSADQTLGLPDFRAAERTFQLLTQVAGRAGRGERPGRVVIQAFQPEHPLLKQAMTQDYEAFYDREIEYRRALRYPPQTALVELTILDRELGRAHGWGQQLADELRASGGGRLLISGPGPAPIERVRGRYRQQILARSAGRRRLVEAVDAALAAVEGDVPRRAVQVDVDPLSVL